MHLLLMQQTDPVAIEEFATRLTLGLSRQLAPKRTWTTCLYLLQRRPPLCSTPVEPNDASELSSFVTRLRGPHINCVLLWSAAQDQKLLISIVCNLRCMCLRPCTLVLNKRTPSANEASKTRRTTAKAFKRCSSCRTGTNWIQQTKSASFVSGMFIWQSCTLFSSPSRIQEPLSCGLWISSTELFQDTWQQLTAVHSQAWSVKNTPDGCKFKTAAESKHPKLLC